MGVGVGVTVGEGVIVGVGVLEGVGVDDGSTVAGGSSKIFLFVVALWQAVSKSTPKIIAIICLKIIRFFIETTLKFFCLLKWDQDQIEGGRGLPGLRIVLCHQRLKSIRGNPDMNVRRST